VSNNKSALSVIGVVHYFYVSHKMTVGDI